MILPSSVCFRVTRLCNARCGFCLAPPDGDHPAAEVLVHRLDWLFPRGVDTVHFCGGEPTIHPALPELVAHVHARGGTVKLTTNGIRFAPGLIPVLRRTSTRVKVSIHGDQAHHDEIVGRPSFAPAVAHVRELLRAGVETSIQTTVVAGSEHVVDDVAALCLSLGVRRLSILPFIPRGSGYRRRVEYGLTPIERRVLHERMAEKRRRLAGRLDVRWLDFTVRPVPVVEPDGRVVLEGPTEGMDELLGQIPAADA